MHWWSQGTLLGQCGDPMEGVGEPASSSWPVSFPPFPQTPQGTRCCHQAPCVSVERARAGVRSPLAVTMKIDFGLAPALGAPFPVLVPAPETPPLPWLAPGDDLHSPGMWCQLFRDFKHPEAEGPQVVCSCLRELWLPQHRSKEQILEPVVLEQVLAILPQEMQRWRPAPRP